MAAVDSSMRPTPPPSTDEVPEDARFERVKYQITTTPPQPRRSLKNNATIGAPPKEDDAQPQHKDTPAPSAHTVKDSSQGKQPTQREPKPTAKPSTDSAAKAQPHSAEATKEDVCHSLHPSLHFVPEDKEHPPREIHRSTPPPRSRSPSPSAPSSSRAPANSPTASPTASPDGGGARRLSQRQQKKALRAQQAGDGHAADDGDVKPDGSSVSKLRLLAPPPINSGRGGGRRGSASRSPSPTPSPSPPPSPYLSPEHPKRRNSFASAINSVLPVHELMGELAPKKIGRHPYVLYPGLFAVTLFAALLVLRIPLTAPLSALWMAMRWSLANPAITGAVFAGLGTVLAVLYRASLYRLYKTVFLPPAGTSLPRPFKVEAIDLTDERWQKMIPVWAQQIDECSTVVEPAVAASSPTDASPAPSHRSDAAEGAVSFDGISGANALALMECYQRGQLDDCTFVCLRIFLEDASLNKTDDGDDTVALTFLSIKNHYDLSPYLLRLFTPIQACFPFLCAPALLSHTIRRWMSFRFCVVGFHWPFRQCVLFTKPLDAFNAFLQLDSHSATLDDITPATDQHMRTHVARYVSVLQLVQQYDREQPKELRSDFMLFPVLTSSHVVDAIQASGGVALPILPTYVVDLRPFKGGEWQDYKRHLRKINRKVREGPFEGAGGSTEVTEGVDVTEEQAKTLTSLWWQVASYRGNKDQTACLMEPNPVYIQQLAHHPARFIQMLALKLKETTVAASLLFSLSPTLMTSDVAGFNYPALEAAGKEANQQIKAYPVKLAAVLKQAISAGYEWVDFGPTTGSSKMEIGAREMPITGGLFYHGTATRVIVQVGALCLSRQHQVAKKALE